ncbi:MAG TPA: DUF883 C-terminal domain-containing protein [Tepidisphaeraceae bacterium]|jgi:ElaB/YqjD/DUF883 family membrane-anchored ribosome-binding protein|nr:DUF883 C-terminal domain-containing protein [Tepidisphaeraceae bacterium]
MGNTSQDAANTIKDGKAAVTETAKNVVDEASRRASEVAGKVKDAGQQAAGYVREQYDHLSDEARHAYDSARDKAYGWEQSAEHYVQRKPLQALLIAAGVGAIMALLWKRHD